MGHVMRLGAVLAALMVGLVAPAAAQESMPQADAAARETTVGETEVSWSGAWELEEDASTDEIATLVTGGEEAENDRLATYSEIVDETVDGPQDAIDVFSQAFLSDPGVSNAIESGSGELDDGGVWKAFTYDLNGMAVATVFAVSETDESMFVVSTVTSTVDVFAETVADAQAQILLDDEAVFLAGIDGAAIAPAPLATPEITPVS